MFKVEIRTHCKECGKEITEKRCRTYCSEKCRRKIYQQKYKVKQAEWQRKNNDKKATKSKDKVQCMICGLWYVQVGSHIWLRHKITAREYREKYELPVKRGIVPLWYRDKKGAQALNNETYLNLKKGKKFRFKKGDKRAINNTFFKGQHIKAKNLSQDVYPH